MHGRDIEVFDLPGFGDQDVKITDMINQWSKDMQNKKFDIVLYTHKSNDTRLIAYDASYFDIVRNSMKEDEFFDRIIFAITFWNQITIEG